MKQLLLDTAKLHANKANTRRQSTVTCSLAARELPNARERT